MSTRPLLFVRCADLHYCIDAISSCNEGIASSSIPFLSASGFGQRYRGELVLDGGILNNVPVFRDGVRPQIVLRLSSVYVAPPYSHARTQTHACLHFLSVFSVVYFWFSLLVFSISNNFIKTRPPSYRSLSLTRARSLALFSVCSSPKVSHAIRRAILLSFSSLFSSSSSSALQPLLLRLALLFSKY